MGAATCLRPSATSRRTKKTADRSAAVIRLCAVHFRARIRPRRTHPSSCTLKRSAIRLFAKRRDRPPPQIVATASPMQRVGLYTASPSKHNRNSTIGVSIVHVLLQICNISSVILDFRVAPWRHGAFSLPETAPERPAGAPTCPGIAAAPAGKSPAFPHAPSGRRPQ